ncbi:hypothetical protein [Serratia marcescens]|uniref:hypothetical protein n=1 Tax=Serratia marcescens TaxID=615 RepID=UPI0011B9EDED|nr:hypothetical protein [Serratia marcescens]TWY30601.1 hypothetical protein FR992_24835 [Serratia marcescens]TYR83316.1 hypothetical protein FYK38_23195 [Serratia marcescens]
MIEISPAEQQRIDDLAYRLTNKPLTKTNIRALNLSPAQVDTIRRACIWGYEPHEIVSMYPYATLAFVLDQRKKFNHKLRRRFQIPVRVKIAMCHCMISDGKSKREIAKLLEVNTQTVNRWLTDHQYPTKLIEQIRHWSVILESLHGPKPLNVSSPIYKPTRKTAKQDEKSRNIVAKERQDKQDYKHRLQAVGH